MTELWSLYNFLYPTQWANAWWALIFVGAAVLPFYSWSTILFSIPIFVFDLILYTNSSSSAVMIFFMYSVPFAFGMAIFGEVVLIPLALISPITGMIGTIIWAFGDIQRYSVEYYIIVIL